MENSATIYTATLDRPVCIKGALAGGGSLATASYLYTGEGYAFKREITGSRWAYLDILYADSISNEDDASPTAKVTVVVPNHWDVVLVLGLIVKYVRDHDTLRVDSRSGRIRDIFQWFVQDAESVRLYLATQDVYQSIHRR
jgi:hypothetical protein